jgi:Ras-related protein Rab-8A
LSFSFLSDIKFFETSAKSNINVGEAFTSIAADIKKRLMDNPANAQGTNGGSQSTILNIDPNKGPKDNKKCC